MTGKQSAAKENPSQNPGRQNIVGTWYAVTAFGLWGFLPIFWKLLTHVSPYETVAHRVVWSCLFCACLLLLRRKRMRKRISNTEHRISNIEGKLNAPSFFKSPSSVPRAAGFDKPLRGRDRGKFSRVIKENKSKIKSLLPAALLLGVNWLTFVYSVNSNQVLEASMGYYINPLVSVFLGLLVLKEKVNLPQKISILLAAAGVLIITFQYGKIPWIALTLAFTFGLYGLIKKRTASAPYEEAVKHIPDYLERKSTGKKNGGVDAVTGLFIETLLMLPIALGFILIMAAKGKGVPVTGPPTTFLLLMSTGAVTAVPLLFFAGAAQRIPLSRVGFIQYLTPTCFFLLGRFVYHEPFSPVQLVSFIFIWAALILYSLSHTAFLKKSQKK